MTKRMNLSDALHRGATQALEDAEAFSSGPRTADPGTPPGKIRIIKPQGLATDQFFYFFLRLRKNEVKRVVLRAQSLYPNDTPERLARRLINTQSTLSFMAGALLHIPFLLPATGNALKFVGFAGGTSIMTRMHLYLILEIAHIYGHDVDDRARVPEMMAIIASSGLAAGAPLLVQRMGWSPMAAIPTAGLTVAAITQIVGNAAIAYYKRRNTGMPQGSVVAA
jgi:hypothetical protein